MTSIVLANGWNATVHAPSSADRGAGLRADGSRRFPAIEEWRSFLERLAAAPEVLPGFTALKFSANGQVIRAKVPVDGAEIEVVCKTSRPPGGMSGWVRRWKGARERRDFDRGLRLLRAGIDTAFPLAVMEHGHPPDAAWLVTEYMDGLVDLDQICLRELPRLERGPQRAYKAAITAAVVGLLVRMRKAGLSHRDLKASNLLLSNWPVPLEGLRVWLVDLEGIHRTPIFAQRRLEKSLIRLAASLHSYKNITRADYARFLRQYLRTAAGDSGGWREAYRRLARAAARYVRRAGLRKHYKLDGFSAED